MSEQQIDGYYAGDIEAAKRAHASRSRPSTRVAVRPAPVTPHPDDAELSDRFAGWYAGDLEFVHAQLH